MPTSTPISLADLRAALDPALRTTRFRPSSLRAAAPAADADATTAPASDLPTFAGVLSTSEPLELIPGVFERLHHTAESVDLSRSAAIPLLRDHDATKQVGAVDSIEIDTAAGVLRSSAIRISRNHPDLATDIQDGIRTHLSVGYDVLDYDITELPAGAGYMIEVKRWKLIEVSSVATPADVSASITRSLRDRLPAIPQSLENNAIQDNTVVNTPHPEPAAAPAIRSVSVSPTTSGATKMNEIVNLCTVAGRPDLLQGMLQRGLSVEQASAELLALRATPAPAPLANLSGRDSAAVQRSYNLNSVMRAQATGSALSGLELEVHQEIARTRSADRGGILVPMSSRAYGTDYQAGLTPGAVTTSRISSIEDAIVATSILAALGAQFEADLPGLLTIPKADGEVAMSWRGESNATALAPSTVPATTQVTMAPKLISGSIVSTLQLIQSAARGMDPATRANQLFGNALAIALDRAAFAGTGTAAHQPLGILNHPDVIAVDFANTAITRSKLLDFMGIVQDQLKGTQAALAYALTSNVQRALEDTLATPGTVSAEYLYTALATGGGRVLGRNAQTTFADVGAAPLLCFGNFSKLRYGTAGTAELVVDPYTRAAHGEIVFTMHAQADTAVVRPEQFVYATNVAV